MRLARKYAWKVGKKNLERSYALRMKLLGAKGKAKGEAAKRLEAYKARVSKSRRRVQSEVWVVDGKKMTRFQVMDYICFLVSSGKSLPKVCDIRGMPDLAMLYGWFQNHPDFEAALDVAEQVRGHRMGEEALEIVNKTDTVNLSVDKLRAEYFSKAAARANKRFQDKAQVEIKDEVAELTRDQAANRIKALIRANPALTEYLPARVAGELGITLDVVAESVESTSNHQPASGT